MTEQSLAIHTEQSYYLAPAAQLNTVLAAYQAKKDFIEKVLRENVDFGPPYAGSEKKTLLKPGAEKLSSFFGLSPTFEDVTVVEDWTGEQHGGEMFFYYRRRCLLHLGGRVIGSAEGSCNSWEKKYRYRWVSEGDIPTALEKTKLKIRGGRVSEFVFAVEKAETTGKYGKPASYWQAFKDAIENGTATPVKRKIKSGEDRDAWEIDSTLYCIPNDDVSEQVNTILKMADKRALVAATLIVTGASDYFTQDTEDFVDSEWHETEQVAKKQATKPIVMTMEQALATKTTKGTMFSNLDHDQLQYMIENPGRATENQLQAASMILAQMAIDPQPEQEEDPQA